MRPGTGISIIACTCLFVAAAIDASEVRKCSARDGQSSYVSGDCPAGTREVWVREMKPEPVAASEPKKAKSNRSPSGERQQAGRHSGGGRRPPHAASKPGQSCEAAKRRRDEVRDRDWYTLTLDQLRALDDRVARACR